MILISRKCIIALSFISLIKINAQNSEWRSQYVKWNIGINYSSGRLQDFDNLEYFNKISGTLSADVALSENDVFDSAPLYIQLFSEISLPVINPYNKNYSYSTISAGVHVKKHLNIGNFKSNLYFFGGAKIEYINYNFKYSHNNNEKNYSQSDIDYVIDFGTGYVFLKQFELFASYSKGLSNKYYADNVFSGQRKMDSFTIGLRFNLADNWWFSN